MVTKAAGRVPLRLLAPFLGLLVLPLAGLLCLGIKLLDQDRVIEAKRAEEQFERGMEGAVTAIQQRMAAVGRRLHCGEMDGATVVEFLPDRVRHCGGERLPWLPVATKLPEAPAQHFDAGERAEFVENNLTTALKQYGALASDPDYAVRAGALLRTARVLRKLNRAAEALALYETMGQMDGVSVSGLPAGLVARTARCRLLAEQGRSSELPSDAAALPRDLDGGRWPIDSAAFDMHRGDAAAWSGEPRNPKREQTAAAAAVLFTRWNSGRLDSESSNAFSYGELTVVWYGRDRSVAVLIGLPEWVERNLLRSSPPGPVDVRVAAANGRRYPGLPWALEGTWREPPAAAQEFAQRRRLVLGFLAVAAILSGASAWFLWRAFGREAALARLQSDFVSAVSHEFRTPLTSMKQIAEVLADGRLIQEDRRQIYYESLGRATQRLQRLVESLLDFGRMEAGAMPYRNDPIVLEDMVRGLAGDFAHEYGRGGYRLEASPAEEALVVRGDRDALGQAVWNLLDNAVKYSAEGKTVRMEMARRGSFAVLRVHDQGMGIPAHERGRIVEKFFRGEEARAAGIKGTGIGLSLVDHIVRSHSGVLEVESEPGKGSTFTIALPLEEHR